MKKDNKYLKVYVIMGDDGPLGIVPATCLTKAWRKFYKLEKKDDPENITMNVLKDMYMLEECHILLSELKKALEEQTC